MEVLFAPIICLCIALIGACFGSFNSLLIYRLPREKSVVFTRSACPVCHHVLGARDLIPVFSWVWARGKCRHCHTAISVRYPILELITALLFLSSYMRYGVSLDFVIIALLLSHVLVLCVIDMQHRIIPDSIQCVIGALGAIYSVHHQMHVGEMLAGIILGAVIGLSLQIGIKWWKKQDGLGMGDVKFMAVSGLWLGIDQLSYFFFAGVFGVITALLWRMVSHDPRFPFGPALALSLVLLVIYPDADQWYQSLSVHIVMSLGII
jgi:leader peptidase (prepilin peptidase)/N-methyltransferase